MSNRPNRKAHDSKTRIMIISLLSALVLMLVIIILLLFRSCQEPEIPDYRPVDTDPTVVTLPPSGGTLEAPEGGGAVSLEFTKEATLNLTDYRVSMHFGNPTNSLQDIVISMYIGDTLICESGRVEPGYKVVSLPLKEGLLKLPSPGTYEGKYVITCYDPVSGEMANVKQEIPITITVVQ